MNSGSSRNYTGIIPDRGDDKTARIVVATQQHIQQSLPMKPSYTGLTVAHLPRQSVAKTVTTTTGIVGKPHIVTTPNAMGLVNYSKTTAKGPILINKPIAPAPLPQGVASHLINPKIQTIKSGGSQATNTSHTISVNTAAVQHPIANQSTHHSAHMASIIRGGPIVQPPRVVTPPQAHAFPAHISRGPAAAISALTKHGSMTTAVLRAQGHTVTASSGVTLNPQLRTPLLSSIRPGTPPSNTARSNSPSIVIPTHQQTIIERLSSSTHPVSTAVQITLQPHRGIVAATHKAIHIPQQTNQSHAISQKVVMTTSTQHILESIPKPVTINTVTSNTAPVTIPSISAIPIAKVHPQRQLIVSQSSIAQQHPIISRPSPGETAKTDPPVIKSVNVVQHNIAMPPFPAQLASHTGHSPSQAGMFSSQPGHRIASASQNMAGGTTVQDSRSERASISHLPFMNDGGTAPHPAFGGYYGQLSLANYQQHTPLYHSLPGQQTHSFSSTTTQRPGLVPSTANLASIQAAVSVSHSSAPGGGVRINPMMMTVDSTRQINIQQQYTSPASSQENNVTINTSSLTTSPRPSILRKRPNEGTIVVKKCLSDPSSATCSPRPDTAPRSNTSSPGPKTSQIDVSLMVSQDSNHSSTDTASSAENSTHSTPPSAATVDVKQEPVDTIENGSAAGTPFSTPTHTGFNSVEASPRKKPRKQLLHATRELKDEPPMSIGSSTDDEVETKASVPSVSGIPAKKQKLDSFIDDEGVQWVAMRKRNQVALLQCYNCNWKSRNNHFLRYNDVKPKDERRPTVNELSNQKGVVQKISGWKMYHLSTQMNDIVDQERDVKTKIKTVQDTLAPHSKHYSVMEDDLAMVHELTQGNIQRCQLVVDQMEEARTAMMKILDHKQKIVEIVNKHHSKRTVKKKERT